MRIPAETSKGLLIALLLAACRGEVASMEAAAAGAQGQAGHGGAAESDPTQVPEIFNWWDDDGERDALLAIKEVHSKRTGVIFSESIKRDADNARAQLEERVAERNPPDAFHANVGMDLLKWTGRNNSPSGLLPLDELLEEDDAAQIDPALVKLTRNNDHAYGIPVNVHRLNSLFYNVKVMAACGVEPPTTIEELKEAARTIRNSDAEGCQGITPLVIGASEPWVLSMLVFEMIYFAWGSPADYYCYWSGMYPNGKTLQPAVQKTLETARELFCAEDPEGSGAFGYFNSDARTTAWPDALKRLADGKAAMAPMGDWARGYLLSHDKIPGKDFKVVPFPGRADGQNVFVFTSDAFVVLDGGRHPEPAKELLRTFASIEGQIAFNLHKGSIPSRLDLNYEKIRECLQDPSPCWDSMPDISEEWLDDSYRQTMDDYRNDARVLAMSGTVPEPAMRDLSEELYASLSPADDCNLEMVERYLLSNYVSLDRQGTYRDFEDLFGDSTPCGSDTGGAAQSDSSAQ